MPRRFCLAGNSYDDHPPAQYQDLAFLENAFAPINALTRRFYFLYQREHP